VSNRGECAKFKEHGGGRGEILSALKVRSAKGEGVHGLTNKADAFCNLRGRAVEEQESLFKASVLRWREVAGDVAKTLTSGQIVTGNCSALIRMTRNVRTGSVAGCFWLGILVLEVTTVLKKRRRSNTVAFFLLSN
jgi:hypothetical protein